MGRWTLRGSRTLLPVALWRDEGQPELHAELQALLEAAVEIPVEIELEP